MSPIIEVDHVVKRYRLGQAHGLRQSLKRLFRGDREPSTKTHFNSLDDVSFSVQAGEVLGIIGTNGAGKSTLLKVLARITTPTSGRVVARGRVAPLIEVGAGLIADLTGRENIYLNGVILGMSVSELKRKFDEIVAFAELEQFIDTPIKRYSSGMAIRLGFAIATAVESDILIVDEVLAVGDIAFQRKCFDRIEDIIKSRGTTILLVSHNIRQVERLCTRALLLDHGRVIMDGNTRDVCQQFYERSNEKIRLRSVEESARATQRPAAAQDKKIELLNIELLNASGMVTSVVPHDTDMRARIRFRNHTAIRRPIFGIGIHTSDMLYLATHQSNQQLDIDTVPPGEYTIECVIRKVTLVPGVYSLRLGIVEGDVVSSAFYGENLLHFQVSAVTNDGFAAGIADGFFALDAHWQAPRNTSSSALLAEAAAA